MRKNERFNPLPFVKGFHQQTILGSMLNVHLLLGSKTQLVELDDGDKIALEVSTPRKWKSHNLTLVMVHGLCGSHRSPYIVRIAKKMMNRGIRVVRMNLRGCGSGRGLCKNIYHCGSSDDVKQVLKYLKAGQPESAISLMGFSLGANIVLKLAGELNCHGPQYLRQVIAISPPINLVSSMRLLCDPSNFMYERYFLRHLLSDIYALHEKYPELGPVYLPEDITVFDLDELYIAPRLGYISAFDYYKSCSSIHQIPKITVPCDILFAEDDPIIDHRDIDSVVLPENVDVHKTKNGGHLGFLGMPGKKAGLHWLDDLLLGWIRK